MVEKIEKKVIRTYRLSQAVATMLDIAKQKTSIAKDRIVETAIKEYFQKQKNK
jgi:predicted transcriptional regulator